jgi:hypothetical protein
MIENTRDEQGRFAQGNDLAREHWFKPGQSGNPGGRPPGLTFVGDWLRHLSRDVDALREALKSNDAAKVIAAKLLLGAYDTSIETNPSTFLSFIREILDRTEGKAKQRMEVAAVVYDTPATLMAAIRASVPPAALTPQPVEPIYMEPIIEQSITPPPSDAKPRRKRSRTVADLKRDAAGSK